MAEDSTVPDPNPPPPPADAEVVLSIGIPARGGHGVRGWLMRGHAEGEGAHSPPGVYPWWKVMCLTGVDYFSTLGYQPGIAFLAAGALAPLATLVLVLVTLFVALPTYSQVAARSPHGQGSIHMLEELLPRWRGKAVVLILLGFAMTDFMITITLSAADSAAHMIENPFAPHWLDHPVLVTSFLLCVLGGIFLRGFKEAIGLAVFLVASYLGLNAILLTEALIEVVRHPDLLSNWRASLLAAHPTPGGMALAALILFPKLALGLSGFETGVAVMPLVKGDPADDPEAPAGRVRNTRKLLVTAAALMSGFLIASSLVTTLLIPPAAFAPEAPRTDGPWPISPTSASGACSAPRTMSRPSPSCGSRDPRRWPPP